MTGRIGKALAHYTILEPIGAGGMGAVYRARDTKLGREVALKVLPPGITEASRLLRFEQEARALAALNHPNIVTVYSVEEAEGTHFLTMELVAGRPLNVALPESGFSLPEFLRIAIALARGLEYAHGKGIIHRDLKPGNVVLTGEGDVKILDFGLAKFLEPEKLPETPDEETTPLLTQAGTVVGTVAYMSPEQIESRAVDARTDLFSLGIVFYEMLAGRRPFQGDSAPALHASILRDVPEPLEEARPDIPAPLVRLVARCLEKAADRRMQAAGEVREQLEGIARDLSSGTAATGSASGASSGPASGTARSSGSSRTRWAAAITTIVLLAAAFLVARLLPRSEDAEASIISIAVLPFQSENPDPDTEYLTDGITESLINQLSRISGLRVLSRTSVFRYKDADPQKAGRELGVAAVLAGRLDNRAANLVVRAELFNVENGVQLWGNRFVSEHITDVLSVEEEISRTIARELEVRLSPEEDAELARRSTRNDEAYDLYLRGRYHWFKRTIPDVKKSLKLFQEAVAADPGFARAYVGIADAYTVGWSYYVEVPPSEGYAKGRDALERALEIDPNLAEARTSLAMVRFESDWDWPGGEEEFRRAISLDPSYVTAHQWYGEYLYCMGRFEESETEIRKALELDPLSPIVNSVLAWSYYMARDYPRAVAQAKKSLELQPDLWDALDCWFQVLVVTDAPNDSLGPVVEHMMQSMGIAPDTIRATMVRFRQEGVNAVFRTLAGLYPEEPLAAAFVAQTGDMERALSMLEARYEERHPALTYIGQVPVFDPFRSEPRFQKILRDLGLPNAR